MAYPQRRQLIWNLLTGLVTDDALRAVLGLLNASNDNELEDLYRDGQLERRLESTIPAGHPLRTELNQLYRERFTARRGARPPVRGSPSAPPGAPAVPPLPG